ncbi:MAG: heme peroxidase [Propionibacteriaceae bacterium]|jgi:Ca2+-binding RTX toxin-like protein|nr:heme peroxidase [Propionibacteriaceae bacterium]
MPDQHARAQKRERTARFGGLTSSAARKLTSGLTALALGVGLLPAALAPSAQAAPVGQGLTLNAGDLRFILKQIKIAENHATKEDSEGKPVPGQPLLGPGPYQIANPLLPYGLRTVDGSDNNLVAGQRTFGTSSLPFPRLAAPQWRTTAGGQTYKSVNQNLTDAEPRFISNVIVDQTATNPAAIAAAGKAHRTVNDEPTAVPCDANGLPAGCVEEGETLDIPNVTTDFGLSSPYNGMFALFGQFFDHGIDFTKKSKKYVMMPLAADDPLMVDGSAARAPFMIMSRAENQPGPDGVLGTADDIQDGTNTNSPWVDQSQTYSSHPAHQVFLREYAIDAAGKPVSTGGLLEDAAGGLATWKDLKAQAADKLGMRLSDTDVANIPMVATDQYGRFLRGPNKLPQYVTKDLKLVEGNLADPVAPPADVQRIGIAFLDDIAHTAAPFHSQTGAPLTADDNTDQTPVTGQQPAGSYDDEMLDAHFVAGDGRVNENIGLTAIHQIFHSEHNRLVTYVEELVTSLNLDLNEWQLAPGVWNGERLFQAARYVAEMEYQHLVFEEFARKIQPGLNPFNAFTQADSGIDPAVMAEFAHATYRFGHSMLTETVDRRTSTGTDIGMPLLQAFLNPPAYYQSSAGTLTPSTAAGAIARGMTDQVGAELDEFVTDTLRNNVLGLPLDLASLNIARGRDTGIPSLNNFRKDLYSKTAESSLKPYTDWVDFGQALKHPDSVVNFMAAYGTHPSIKEATSIQARRAAAQLLFDMNTENADTPADAFDFVNSSGTWANDGANSKTGVDAIELWVGGLAESQNLFGGLLGSTFNYIFERQMTDLQDGDRLYYLSRTSGLNLRTQLEGNSFAELIMRNTDATALKADVFGVADCEFEMANVVATTGNNVADDPASACDESKLLLRMADGTIRYRVSNTVDRPGLNAQSTYNGTDGADKVWGGVDNDTFWGNDGNDVIEGNDGADTVLGGDGNDKITDSHGDDVLKGGNGNDAIDAGPGLDIIMSGEGDDFSNGGLNGNQTFAGEGNDLVLAGDGPDTVFGGGGDDWQEGGNSNDLLQGDSGAPFFDDLNRPGHDVLIGDSGEDDYDAEGGDDIMVAGPGIERNHGLYGFDWVTHARSIEAADSDMRMVVVEGPNALRDRFLLTEALSGWDKNDMLRGTDTAPSDPDTEVSVPGMTNTLDEEGIKRIAGLADLLPAGAQEFGAGNIILGGAGSDQIWGNGADDIIDGNKWLNVRLNVRNAAGEEIRSANSLKELQADIMAGTIDPGNVGIVREILNTSVAADIDTANFSGPRSEYDITSSDGVTTVDHVRGTGADGTDRISNVERLRFTDLTVGLDVAVPVIGTPVAGDSQATVSFSGPAGASFLVRVVNAAGAQVGALRPAPTGATSLVVTGLTNGTAYRFQVAAVTADSTSDYSALSTAVTPVTAATVAGAPTMGTVTAGNASATLRWTAPANTGGAPITGYSIRIYVGSSSTPLRTTAVGNVTSTVIDTLTNQTGYTFDVRAINAAGTGDPSARSSVTTPRTEFVAPTVTTLTPADGARSVSQSGNVTATFSEAVTVGGANFVLRLGTALVPAAVSYSSTTRVATLNPTSNLLADRTYTATLTDVRDSAGNPMPARTWSFTTGPAPIMGTRSPAAGAVGIRRNSNVTANFSEAITGFNATTVRLTSATTGAVISGQVLFNTSSRVLTLDPGVTLASNTRYRVTITGGATAVRDLAGNPMSTQTWTFTTGSAL